MDRKSYTVYESEMPAPLYVEPTSLEFVVDRIREVAFPLIVVRFEDKTGIEAQELLGEINHELASRGLTGFPAVSKRRIRNA